MRKLLFILFCLAWLGASAQGSSGVGLRGDMDGDGRLSMKDLTLLIKYLEDCEAGLGATQTAIQMRANADVDRSGRLTVADVSALRDILLSGKDDGGGSDQNPVVHEAVDLGLSVKWATMNIGATSVTDYGDYFAWGETYPKQSYTEENYLYYFDGAFQSIGNDIGGTRYDVAKAQWGDEWRLPTLIDINQLKSKCTWQLVTLNGVNVYRVTGPNGNCIYMPLSGYRMGDGTLYAGSDFYYWCSMKPSTASAAYCLFSQNYTGSWSANRSYGFTIRPVKK